LRGIRVGPVARGHLREIHGYSRELWGERRADAYIERLSRCFGDIASGRVRSRPVAAEFGVDGRYVRCGAHYIYWRPLGPEAIAIVAVLHQRMHQDDRVTAAFGPLE
jgi:toxin ParE1/3/4